MAAKRTRMTRVVVYMSDDTEYHFPVAKKISAGEFTISYDSIVVPSDSPFKAHQIITPATLTLRAKIDTPIRRAGPIKSPAKASRRRRWV